jgi:(hydroxyamino)benzene mutase
MHGLRKSNSNAPPIPATLKMKWDRNAGGCTATCTYIITDIRTAAHPLSSTTTQTTPVMSQSAMSVGLLKSGSLLLASAFTWGIFIPATPFPRIALSNHMNMIQHGFLSIGCGLILYQEGLIDLSEWQVWLVGLSHFYLWLLDFVSICNAWWGTSKTLQLVPPSERYLLMSSWPRSLVPPEGRLGRKFWSN